MNETAVALSLGGITFLLTVIWGGPMVQILRQMGVGKGRNAISARWAPRPWAAC
jgi:hypothetical protein